MIYLLLILPGLPLALFAAVCICARLPRRMEKSDCIIVLGAKVRPGGALSHSLEHRCRRAYALYRQGMGGCMIVCGGQAGDEPMPEAYAMRRFLMDLGAPASGILAEDRSRSTSENLANAAGIMRARGFRNALIVTSDYHIQRAAWLARDIGIAACFAKAQASVRLKSRVKARAKESVSWVLYFARKLRR